MSLKHPLPMVALVLLAGLAAPARSEDGGRDVKEAKLVAPDGPTIKVRMEGPYDADTPLQVICYVQHRTGGDRTLGAAVELDKRLGGVIASLRNRGEFEGEALETLLLTPHEGTIKPQRLLLIGLGDERSLSLDTMERVGRTALRQAARLGVKRVAFAPLLRDQGNSTLAVGDVEAAVVRGVLLAYDTDRRLQKEGLAGEYTLEEWVVEAGPAYFDDTVAGVERGIAGAKKVAAERPAFPYARPNE